MRRFEAMEAFVHVVKNGNFISAASELGISPGQVTKLVMQLERTLGAKLLTRTTRRLSITEIGQRYYKFSSRILKEMRQEEIEINQLQHQPLGPLRVMAPMSFSIMEMWKLISAFQAENPKVEVLLIIGNATQRSSDPVEYGADVAIRFEMPEDSNLLVRRIGTMTWVACASPDYLHKMGVPRKPGDLPQHSCLVASTRFKTGVWSFEGPAGNESVKVAGPVSPSSVISMGHMAADGAGVALLPLFCAAEYLRSGRLVKVLKDYKVVPDEGIYALHSHGRDMPVKTRLFVDFLAARFQKPHWENLSMKREAERTPNPEKRPKQKPTRRGTS
jgi:DNA-binding transcriptional LysR family regulator